MHNIFSQKLVRGAVGFLGRPQGDPNSTPTRPRPTTDRSRPRAARARPKPHPNPTPPRPRHRPKKRPKIDAGPTPVDWFALKSGPNPAHKIDPKATPMPTPQRSKPKRPRPRFSTPSLGPSSTTTRPPAARPRIDPGSTPLRRKSDPSANPHRSQSGPKASPYQSASCPTCAAFSIAPTVSSGAAANSGLEPRSAAKCEFRHGARPTEIEPRTPKTTRGTINCSSFRANTRSVPPPEQPPPGATNGQFGLLATRCLGGTKCS